MARALGAGALEALEALGALEVLGALGAAGAAGTGTSSIALTRTISCTLPDLKALQIVLT